jgi:hypothetical protein
MVPVFGQQPSDSWSPYRDRTLSKQDQHRQVAKSQVRWPSPVRLAQYSEASLQEQPTTGDGGYYADDVATHHEAIDPRSLSSDFTANHPSHAVIRPPPSGPRNEHKTIFSQEGQPSGFVSRSRNMNPVVSHGKTDQIDQPLPPPPVHGENSRFGRKKWPLGPVQPRTASIPGGRERPVWKQPYSYGYFGASGKRRWETHHGYRDRYTEYRFR